MQKHPDSVTILGIPYSISYVQNAGEVDIFKRDSLHGQIDYWTRTIRIFDDGTRPDQDIFATLLHETLHGILDEQHLELARAGADHSENDAVDMLAVALADVLTRNGWLELER